MIAIDRKALVDAVAFASRALPNRAPHPVLNGLRIATTEGTVAISAFDYDTYAEATISQVCTAGVELLMPGRALGSYLSGMQGSTVTIEAEDSRVNLSCGSAKVTLPRLSIDDYPSAPPVPASVGTVDGEELAGALASAREAIDPNNAVVPLRGYILDAPSDSLVVASGSRFAFAVRDMGSWTGDGGWQALVPITAGEAARSMAGPVVVGHADGRVSLSTDDRTVSVRLIEGEAPKYNALFDAYKPTTTVTVDRVELVDRLKWIALGDTRKDARGQCILTIDADGIGIALWGADGLDVTDSVEAKVDGDGLEIGWKAQYLLDGLAATSAATVTLSLASATKPCLIRAESDPGFRYLAMPMRLK